jgi:hypothetical protein
MRISLLFSSVSRPWSALLLASVLGSCGPSGTPHARQVIRETHAQEVKRILVEDVQRHLRGSDRAAERLVPGFAIEDPVKREAQIRTALRLLTKPPRGISELVASARTFTAAVASDGTVLATDAKDENDRMTGANLREPFSVLHDALEGKTGYAIHQFPSIKKGVEGSISLLFAAPAKKDEKIVGAVLTGIPLWRLAQRLTRQIQLDHVGEKGAILWVYLYRGDKLHHFGTPPDLDTVVPDAATRKAGLAKSPGGFTGELLQFGRWYAYGVFPLKLLGPDMGAVVFRSDPL